MRRTMAIVVALLGACGPRERPAAAACERLEVGALCSFVDHRGPLVGVCVQETGGAALCVVPSVSEAQLACAGAARGDRCAFEASTGRVEGRCGGPELGCRQIEPRRRRFIAESLS